jgi:hypothetical protein
MRKIIFAVSLSFLSVVFRAQYAAINAILERLEENRGLNRGLKDVDINGMKFVLIKDFNDHTERNFIVINGNQATYVEIFDDKSSGESTSNVFSGDIVRSKHNVISLRADKLEGKEIPIPITKIFLMTNQSKIIYLIDANNKDRWIEEGVLKK